MANVKRGTCEVCDAENVDVYVMHGNIWMCSDCKTKEEAVVTRQADVINMIEVSRKIDTAIELKSDLFNASTVAAIELRAAIDNDASIPADKKDYAYAQECMTRFKHMQSVIFQQRKELLEKENEMKMWQINVQTAAGKLREQYRQEFKDVDIAYQPVTPTTKSIKASTGVKKSKGFSKSALNAAADKYGVPANAVQSLHVSRNIPHDEAAKQLAIMMGLPLPN